MDLTDKQWSFMEALVSNFESIGSAEFCLTPSDTANGLSYEGPASITDVYDRTDLYKLELERMITLNPDPPNRFRGKLTQHGISIVSRRLMQQWFRTLKVTPVVNDLKPEGVQLVHFPDPRGIASQWEDKGRAGMETDPNALILEHPGFPLKPYLREKVKNEITTVEKNFTAAEQIRGWQRWAQWTWRPEGEGQLLDQQAKERRQDVLENFCLRFFIYIKAYLDSRFDFQQLSVVLPWLYEELLQQTFILRWRRGPANDSDEEEAVLATLIAEHVSQSVGRAEFASEFRRLTRRVNYVVPNDFSILELLRWLKVRTAPASAAAEPRFRNREAWLIERLSERGWNKHHLQRHGGPEHRTTQKILDGSNVQEDVFRKVIAGLQSKRTHKGHALPAIAESDIPND